MTTADIPAGCRAGRPPPFGRPKTLTRRGRATGEGLFGAAAARAPASAWAPRQLELPAVGHHLVDAAGRPRAAVGTVVFLDVDGVLNVGIKDPPMKPILLSTDNVSKALCSESALGARIMGVCGRHQRGQAPGGGAAYSELASDASTGVSEVLVGRLAEVLRGAGDGRLVVLASSWRDPSHRPKVERLEQRISHALGEPFRFDDTTRVCKDSSPAARLACIGDYVSDHCGGWQSSARVLVLEDFHINPLGGWSVDGLPVRGAADVEAYLKSRAPPTSDLSVLLLHTVDQWTSAEGLLEQIGGGLSWQDVERAMKFFAQDMEPSEAIIGTLLAPPSALGAPWPRQPGPGQLLWWSALSLKALAAHGLDP